MTTIAVRIGPRAPRAARLAPARPVVHGTVVPVRYHAQAAELPAAMARAAKGDQQAFAEVYDATAGQVFGIVLAVLRDRAQAEEVTQEVYVDAWRTAVRFDVERGSVTAWLNTMAHRKAVDRVRSSERRTARELRHAEAGLPHERSLDTSDLVVDRDEAARVRRAVETLPDVQRDAVALAYFAGRTHREVAEQLQIPLGTAKTRIRDAMRRLRTQLEEGR
jgi:RNA polymerase sigma-70 factor, ECF subfamily